MCLHPSGRTDTFYLSARASCHLTLHKIESASETGAEASTAPTEIENLVALSANDISALPKWSPTVVKEEHNRDIITGRTLTISIFL